MEEKERNLSFNWYGSDITFSYLNGTSMINATEMAKPFKKRPSKWLELPSTKEFLKALQTIHSMDSLDKLIIPQKSGSIGTRGGGCTWFHEDVALEYAKWLDPKLKTPLLISLKNNKYINLQDRLVNYDSEVLIEYYGDLIEFIEDNNSTILDIFGDKSDEIFLDELNKYLDIYYMDEKLTFIIKNNNEISYFTRKELLEFALSMGDDVFLYKTIKFIDNFLDKKSIDSKDYLLIRYLTLSDLLSNINQRYQINTNSTKTKKTYLMNDSNTGYTKIGNAINPKFREKTLQSEKPSISLFAISEDFIETKLHEQYSNKRVRGEWFNLTTDEINHIVNKYKFKTIL